MADFRFLHAADIHLDSPLRGLESDPFAPVETIRAATRRAFGRLVDLAIAEKVDFVLIAGDIYDGDWPDFGTGLYFSTQTRRLDQAAIPVFAIRGNHDAANRMTRSLRMPHVTIFDHATAHTHRLEALGVAIHGQSFADQAVTDDLSRKYPPPIEGLFNIGLLHTSAEGYTAHARYAPCELSRLRSHGYDYWALGHVHERQELCRDPWIVFPGNLQGRHINETGPKGASLVTVSGGAVSVEPHVLDVLRWARVNVDLDGAANETEAMSRVQTELEAALRDAEPWPLAARITLTGTTGAHAALFREGLRDKVLNEAQGLTGEHRLWLEAVKLRTRPPRDTGLPSEPELPARQDNLGRLLTEIDALAAAPPPGLLGNWPNLLFDRLREALPDDHPLHACANGDLSGILRQARDRLEAALSGET
ncbi:metallophosphoesterase family protein [Rhodopila sp.]|uniref:metallophosphoesterase family protein n=1 Tax=Rhodopila sp. TaxID=2480087 RepID=UPI003D0E4F29